MKVDMSESTFNLVASILNSDLSLPIKNAKAAAIAQDEWRVAAEAHNNQKDEE